MRGRFGTAAIAVAAAVSSASLVVMVTPVVGQRDRATYRAPRTADGRPNLSGIWQANTTANFDLEGHAAKPSPVIALGAAGAVPAGLGVVVGNEIPYRPDALARKRANAENWLTSDPEIKCFMPGVPRATYLPFPFQIVQTPAAVVVAYEFAGANRVIDMAGAVDAPVDSWMGYSAGRWEGDTLVVEVKGFNNQTWFDRAGNYHSEALKVTERYTPSSPDALLYEATIEDAKVFTRPWTISLPLYRRLERNARLLEFKCVEFVEELMYGHLRKPPAR